MIDLNAQIAAVADQPKVIAARNYMDECNVVRAEAEAVYIAAQKAFQAAGVRADTASDMFWDAVAEAQPLDRA